LRGATALWVVAFHSSQLLPLNSSPIIANGFLGVDVFFVLSGFILGHVYLDEFRSLRAGASGHFLMQRFARIYPVHFIMLMAAALYAVALYLAGADVLHHPRYQPELFIANLTLVQAWGWSQDAGFNTVAWSISAELLAYLLFPLLAVTANRLGPKTALACAFLVLASGTAALHALDARAVSPIVSAPLRVGGEFVCGLLLYTVYREKLLERLPWGAITTLATAAFVACAGTGRIYAAIFFIPPIVMGLAYGQGPVGRFLAAPTLMYLGEVSYSLYMVHRLTMEIAFAPIDLTHLNEVATLPMRVGLLIVAWVAVAAATVAIHRYVEVPARGLMRDRLAQVMQRAMPIAVRTVAVPTALLIVGGVLLN
jgi:peptidoglycan/LPS O-acetylase OafA/YrhL